MERTECKHNTGVGCLDPSQCAACGWNPAEKQRRIRAQKEGRVALERRAQVTTYFDQITTSPETLAEFLESIQVIDGPWDHLFQKKFCTKCRAPDCHRCPHKADRNSPAWFLAQEVVNDGNDPLW